MASSKIHKEMAKGLDFFSIQNGWTGKPIFEKIKIISEIYCGTLDKGFNCNTKEYIRARFHVRYCENLIVILYQPFYNLNWAFRFHIYSDYNKFKHLFDYMEDGFHGDDILESWCLDQMNTETLHTLSIIKDTYKAGKDFSINSLKNYLNNI